MNRPYIRHSPSRTALLANTILHMNPVAYWPLNERSGSVATNRDSINRYSKNGTITTTTLGQPGKQRLGTSFTFDGSTSFVDTAMAVPAIISYVAIINIGTSATSRSVLAAHGDGTFQMRISSTHFGQLLKAASAAIGTGSAAQPTGTWSMIGGSYNPGTGAYVIYRNGLPNGSGTNVQTLNAGNIMIGVKETNVPAKAEFFTGSMQHVAVFDRVLTAGEFLKIARVGGFA